MHENEPESSFAVDPPESPAERYDISKLKKGLQRHLWLIAASTIAFALFASSSTYNFLSNYKAEAIVIFQAENNPKNIVTGLMIADFTLATALDIIKLPGNLQAVKSRLGLKESPKQIGGMYDIPTPRNESNLIRIVAQSGDPQMAINLANTLAEVAVKNSQEFSLKELRDALRSYQNQLEVTKNRLTIQLSELENFKRDNEYLDMSTENSSLLRELTEGKRNLLNAEINYNSMLVEYENLKKEIENLPPSSRAPASNALQMHIASLESALAEARSKFAPNNPKLKQLEHELAELRAKAEQKNGEKSDNSWAGGIPGSRENLDVELIRMQGRVRAAQKRKEDLTKKLEELQKLQLELPKLQVAFSKLLQAKSLTEEQIAYLTKSIEQLQLMTNSPKGSIELYQAALEAKPSRDSLLVYLLPFFGLFFGFGVGVGLALLLEIFDNKIRTEKQVSLDYKIPCWLVVPELPGLKPSEAEPRLRFFTRQLEERLDKLQAGRKSFKVALTSAQEGEGKSLFAAQLAAYNAERDKRTALLSMDPRPSPYKPVSDKKGLEEYLKGKAALQDILISGAYTAAVMHLEESSMKELVKSRRMDELWKYLEENFECVIVDAPGIIADDYSINLSHQCDATVFIIGSSQTSKSLIDESLKELATKGVTPAGILLNRVLPVYIEDERILRQLKRHWDE